MSKRKTSGSNPTKPKTSRKPKNKTVIADLLRYVGDQYVYFKAVPTIVGLLALRTPEFMEEYLQEWAADCLSPKGIAELTNEGQAKYIPLLRKLIEQKKPLLTSSPVVRLAESFADTVDKSEFAQTIAVMTGGLLQSDQPEVVEFIKIALGRWAPSTLTKLTALNM